MPGDSAGPPAGPPEVTVYSTPFCAPCEQLKRFLKDNGIGFTVRDLMMDEDAADRLEAKGIRSTPALEVNGEIYAGETLDPARVRALVGIA
jgi:glutaredoxin-like protein NrdH